MAHGSTHFDILAPKSKFYQGPFGRICGDLPAWESPFSDDELFDIANDKMVERPGKKPGDLAADPGAIADLEAEFNSEIPAGYTYFGQFVDHDITFDPASSLMRANDPNGLLNFRTPRLDLDNLYGAGPDDQPYLYDPTDKAKMAIGEVAGSPGLPDLPRFHDRALIGDMRNDENAMVSQLQLAFLLAHNTLVDRARAEDPAADMHTVFERARRTLRWLYQHIVWFDFLPRVLIDDIVKCALTREKVCGGRQVWKCGLDDLYSWKNQPFMPVEFSVAAYRFGHSMVRNGYQTNNPVRGFGNFAAIFDNTGPANPDDLRGFRPISPENSIQWDWFLPMQSSTGPFPQLARKIDTKLANALAFLHEGPAGDALNVLAFRNLKRGIAFGLPSGTDVAKKFCVKPVTLKEGEPDALWYYILREAEANGGNGLGRVGSIIVAAVFAGLLKGDPCSWFTLDPCWTPKSDPLLRDGVDNVDDANWTLASIIRLAGLKADGIGFEVEGAAP
ncbi:heme peroxidase [Roseivivax sp. THAF40]|uniref:peroxidase family protein n=1 Tax=unclassified Roseivivax TaxID=2639302 RepID=UPI0012692043|nr:MULTISPECIES: heme peroxidase family protein [unclassified Roseivivax]QFS81789.1 heme peroxidase [Roseivivax sp. THAF197b]QFT45589.1 heme peroxidase [Roseivivax sp. THAF40]